MRIVVTGGAGFIGSELVEELTKDNEVIVIDDISTGKRENIDKSKVEFVQGSIIDLELLKKVFEDVDYVFHQAAIPSVQRSVENPLATNEVNVKGTLNILIAAKINGVKKVIYASSSSVYGDTPELPKRENMNPDPLSPYAVSKLTGEYYCNVFNKIYDLKTICLRYFNVFGVKQNSNSDYATVIPKFINRVSENKSLTIYGDGKQTRDFVYVKDVIRANILAMKSNITGIYNIASGRRISINEIAEMIIRNSNKNLKIIYDAERESDIKNSYGDISKAKKDLDYEPKYKLEDELRRMTR